MVSIEVVLLVGIMYLSLMVPLVLTYQRSRSRGSRHSNN